MEQLGGKLQKGDVVREYRVESVLGDGHFGIVYQVSHTTQYEINIYGQQVPKLFALKELLHTHPKYVTGFFREAAILTMLNRVSDSNMVRYIDQFEENGIQYMVMEFVKGQSLTKLSKKAISEQLLIQIGIEMGRGLSRLHAHQPSLIHRDIKPDNVRVRVKNETNGSQSVRLTILDLGIAEVLDGTQVSERCGTARYAHPDQLKGSVAHPFMDQHALGATLFYLMMSQVSLLEDQLLLPYPFEKWNTPAERQLILSHYPKFFQKIAETIHGGILPDKWDAFAQAKASLSKTGYSNHVQAIVLRMISYKDADKFRSVGDGVKELSAIRGQPTAILSPALVVAGQRIPTALLSNPPTIFQAVPIPVPSPLKPQAAHKKPIVNQSPAPKPKQSHTGFFKWAGVILAITLIILMGLALFGPDLGTVSYDNVGQSQAQINREQATTMSPTNAPIILPSVVPTETKPLPVKLLAQNVPNFMSFGPVNRPDYAVWSPDNTQVAFNQTQPDRTGGVGIVMNILTATRTVYNPVDMYWGRVPFTTAWAVPRENVLNLEDIPPAEEMGLKDDFIPSGKGQGYSEEEIRSYFFTYKNDDFGSLAPVVISWDKKRIAFITHQYNFYIANVTWDPDLGRYVLDYS